jgi:hypothetical protein
MTRAVLAVVMLCALLACARGSARADERACNLYAKALAPSAGSQQRIRTLMKEADAAAAHADSAIRTASRAYVDFFDRKAQFPLRSNPLTDLIQACKHAGVDVIHAAVAPSAR